MLLAFVTEMHETRGSQQLQRSGNSVGRCREKEQASFGLSSGHCLDGFRMITDSKAGLHLACMMHRNNLTVYWSLLELDLPDKFRLC